MANKVIQFTVSADGEISPKVEQAAGVQGSHNVTKVEFDVSGLSYTFTNDNIKVRIHMIDGAGGFESTGFLTVEENKVCTLLRRRFTNAGGVAKVYLVVTKITYDGDGFAHEEEVYMSQGGKLRFDGSGVGSPSNDIYLKGISSALVNAETFVRLAETASDDAKKYKDEAGVFKDAAETAKSEAMQYANDADLSATSARISSQAAGSFATDASNFATSASNSANQASQSEQNARKYSENADYLAREISEALGDVGNIETALDNIIAIQNQLIGGDA